nr:hypothetical protein [Cronobacter dublinensis]
MCYQKKRYYSKSTVKITSPVEDSVTLTEQGAPPCIFFRKRRAIWVIPACAPIEKLIRLVTA